jgi:GDP-4-dehydro-6-deoxy-D-mannose reductase
VSGHPLVTGATGFAGSHLVDSLTADGTRVFGWANLGGRPPDRSRPAVTWQSVDLLDRDAVRRALAEAAPSAIYHCAGVADVQGSWRAPGRALRVNVIGTHHVLDAADALGLQVPILVTGSALVYRPSDTAVDEDHPLGPTSPYGVSKLAQEMLALESPLPVLIARPFNHAGPRQDTSYVTSAFARQLAEIEAGRHEPVLRVGNLDSMRDITDVRDTVAAYRALVERGTPRRPYNVCRGKAYRMRDLLDILLSLARVDVRVEQEASRLRPSDIPVVLGSHARLTAETGWTPQIPIEQTLADLLAYWRTAPALLDSRPA